jgi:hypothetical protein
MIGDRGDGGPPVSGWAKLVAELLVRDFGTSSTFWQNMLGFRIAHKRSEQHLCIWSPQKVRSSCCASGVGIGILRYSIYRKVAAPCSMFTSKI